jgi:Ca-activated chloride channel homolog
VRKRVSEVRLTLVATDQNDRPLPHLSPTDILVLEDGQPIPRFELRSAADLPLRIGVVLDLSDSTQKSWATVRSALVRSLQQVMRPNDELRVLAFNSKIELERTVTDPVQLGTVLEDQAIGRMTALYDTLYHVCDDAVFVDERAPHRSALIVFSDGEDDLSLHGLGDAIARAQRSGVAIYTVAAQNPNKTTSGDAVLHDLATTTGGRDFVVKNADQLADVLSTINAELRNSYLLYYRVPEESGVRAFRRVHVIPTQRDGSRVRSRAGYFTTP